MQVKFITASGPVLKKGAIFILRRDRWDDFGLKTSFQLEYLQENGEKITIGTVKIARFGQKSGSTEIPSEFNSLDVEYFSLGQSEEYYENIRDIFKEKSNEILKSLNDLSTLESIEKIQSEASYSMSLARDIGTARLINEIRKDDHDNRNNKNYKNNNEFTLSYKFQPRQSKEKVLIEFPFINDDYNLGRINILIGKNGAGKTQILANLVGAITGIGQTSDISSSRERFTKIFAVSYSIYDQFFLPDDIKIPNRISKKEYISNRIKYEYIGVREKNKDEKTFRIVGTAFLCKKFNESLKIIEKKGSISEFTAIIDTILRETSLKIDISSETSLKTQFKNLGAGHKVSISILAQLFAKIQDNSLVVIDEPENHLHPNLVSSVLTAIREIISLKKSYAIISTHSPIIAQETPAKFINIVKRIGNTTVIEKLHKESFGSSLDKITEQIFSVSSDMPYYRSVLKTAGKKGQELSVFNGVMETPLSPEALTLFFSMGGKE